MKIGLVLSRPPGYSETFFRNKITGLINQGIEVELFVETQDKKFSLCPQHVLPGKHLFYAVFYPVFTLIRHPLRSARFLKLEFKAKKKFLDVLKNFYLNIHLLNSSGLNWVHFGFATMAVNRENIAAAIQAKMGISIRGFDISRFPLRHPGIYRSVWKQANKVHTISNALLLKARANGMPENLNYEKITPAVDTVYFNSENRREGFQNPVQLLTVGRLHWSKGMEYAIQAMALLKARGMDFHYTIVGDGKDLERLVLAAYQCDVSDRITFAGKQDLEQTKSYYRNSDIYIQYSVQEGFCNSVLEAQATGLLCVVSDAEGLPENILNETTGWVVPRRSPVLLANKIMDIMNEDPGKIHKIRQQARQRVVETFNLENQICAFVGFFNESAK